MKIIFYSIVLTQIIFSCQSLKKKNVNEESLKTYFTSLVKKNDSTMKLESFKFIKLDTTTLQQQYIQIEYDISSLLESNGLKFDRIMEEIKSNNKIAALYSDLDYKLYKNYRDEAADKIIEARKIRTQDSLILLDMNKLDTLRSKADSIKPVMYKARCAYTIKKQDQSIIKDTANISLNLDYEILSNEEYFKDLNRLYKPLSEFTYK